MCFFFTKSIYNEYIGPYFSITRCSTIFVSEPPELNTNCKRGVVSPTLNVNPTLFVIPCKKLGDYRFTML